MKNLYKILSLSALVLLSACGGTSRFSADYDDIYFSAKKDKHETNQSNETTITSISKNDEVITGTKNESEKTTNSDVVVLKPYTRENNETNFNNNNSRRYYA